MKVFVDVETTGLNAQSEFVIAVAIKGIDGPLDWVENIQMPEGAVNGAFHINGLSGQGVDRQWAFGQIAHILSDAEEVWAHNAPFDEGFIRAEFARMGIEVSIPKFRCSGLALRDRMGVTGTRADGSLRIPGLKACVERFMPFEDTSSHHRCEWDASVGASLVELVINEANDIGLW